ncbi:MULTISPECIES: A24 family peptidase [Hyphomonas]|uniref:Peptidase A24 n=1 Tax=Hyphomonas adhaerens TaxID=81029 RepID=A0A3B9GT48_9PROT|nr:MULTISPECIES: prepilin peptidase [Hyphomonas]MBB38907.1 peptidase A24 [Hyphomonas sp.]HAE25630.1 peptidase A24 [Hyphomonas adhaerens]|tara:strand:- start:12791 stop:13306 length:516 start_codon:yes stop_codon:yes gene_type:complete
MILVILGGVFLALCLFAALHDVNSLTIPNWLNLTLACLFVPAAVFSGLPMEIIFGHVLVGLATFVIAFGLFAFRIFGGGDAKMIPAVMLWVGPTASLEFIFSMALVGGLCAIVIVLVRNTVPAVVLPGPIRAPFEENAGIPYGIAIAAGVFMASPESPILSQTLSSAGLIG